MFSGSSGSSKWRGERLLKTTLLPLPGHSQVMKIELSARICVYQRHLRSIFGLVFHAAGGATADENVGRVANPSYELIFQGSSQPYWRRCLSSAWRFIRLVPAALRG